MQPRLLPHSSKCNQTALPNHSCCRTPTKIIIYVLVVQPCVFPHGKQHPCGFDALLYLLPRSNQELDFFFFFLVATMVVAKRQAATREPSCATIIFAIPQVEIRCSCCATLIVAVPPCLLPHSSQQQADDLHVQHKVSRPRSVLWSVTSSQCQCVRQTYARHRGGC